MSKEEFDRLLAEARQTKDKDGYYLWGDRWVKDAPAEETHLHFASSENEMSISTLRELMRVGVPFEGRLEMIHGRPKLKAKLNQSIHIYDDEYEYGWINTWFTGEVYSTIVTYLLWGAIGNLPKLKYGDYPESPVEVDYLYRHIKREIARGNEWVIFNEEDNGTRVIAKYPYGTLDYGVFPHTLDELHEYLTDIQPFIFDAPTYDIPDLHNNDLPIREVEATSKDQTLADIFKEPFKGDIPTNCIIDKTICGVGATWLEIHADRNSVIIEPNVPVIIGKMQKHPNIIGIYGEDMTAEKIAELIQEKRENGDKVKLMTTPDSYNKIVSAIKQLQIPFYNDYFMLFDECEKIVSDIDFRPKISLPIDDFFLFQSKAMVSATPIIIDDPRFKLHNFEVLKVVPTYDYRKDLKLIGTNIVMKTVQTELSGLDGTICIFYNSVDGITDLMDFLELDEEQVNIYCSTDAKKKLQKDKRKNIYDSITDKLNKYNFFTSRFYSAVDIELDYKPHVIMVSDVYKRLGKLTPYSLIDPETEAVQIAGRFRNGIDQLIHVTNTEPNKLEFKLKDELEQFLSEQHDGYTELAELKSKAESEGKQQFFKEAIERTDYASGGFVNDNGSKNYFRYNNAYLDERLKMLYCNPARLYKAYCRSGAFNVKSEGIFAIYSDEDRRILKNANTPKAERIKRLHKIYSDSTDANSLLDKRLLDEIGRDNPQYLLYMDAFHYIGFHAMRKLDFVDRDIKKAVTEAKFKLEVTTPKICNEVYKVFEEDKFYSNAFIEDNLKQIWDAEKVNHSGRIMKHIAFYFHAESAKTEYERGRKLGLKRTN